MDKKKTYYQIQLDALNNIEKLKDKKEYIKTIDFSQKIEDDQDAERIKSIRVFNDYLEEGIFKDSEVDEKEIEEGDYLTLSYGNKPSVDVDLFVDYILNKFTFKTIFGTKKDNVFVYEEGVYVLKGEEIIKTFSEDKLGKHCKNNIVLEIIGKIKRKTAMDFNKFDQTPINLIPLVNGIYNFESGELEKHSPNNYFKFKIPIVFEKETGCPKFLNFLSETLYEEDINLIQEWFGFCLYRRYLHKKGMIWFGEKDTGKTTLFNILEGLFGEENLSGLSLHEISEGNGFDLKNLYNKHINSYDDLSSQDIGDGGGFKIATGGGRITAEYKFGDQFKFHNFSKLLFACNKIPSPKDINDPAYFSRWFPIPFDNQVNRKEQDLHIADKCLKEASGIFNWMIIGLKRLLENNEFSFKKEHEEVKAIMCRSGNPIFAFVQDKCFESDRLWISKQDLYDKYCEYMSKNKLPKMTKDKFSKNILRHCTYLINGRRENHRGWYNIRVGSLKTEKLGNGGGKVYS